MNCNHDLECTIYYPALDKTFHCYEGSKRAYELSLPVSQCKKCKKYIPIFVLTIPKHHIIKGRRHDIS